MADSPDSPRVATAMAAELKIDPKTGKVIGKEKD